MISIGGKTKTVKASQPQYVVQIAEHINQYAQFKTDDEGEVHIIWIGDPNSATKFDSKYGAKARIREIVNVPDTRMFKQV